jgi:hypothetical protein
MPISKIFDSIVTSSNGEVDATDMPGCVLVSGSCPEGCATAGNQGGETLICLCLGTGGKCGWDWKNAQENQ